MHEVVGLVKEPGSRDQDSHYVAQRSCNIRIERGDELSFKELRERVCITDP